MPIQLRPEVKKDLRRSIQRFFSEQLDEEVGDLKADLTLDYVLKEIGPSIYNQALLDAQAYLQGQLEELEAVCHQAEFTYFNDGAPPSPLPSNCSTR